MSSRWLRSAAAAAVLGSVLLGIGRPASAEDPPSEPRPTTSSGDITGQVVGGEPIDITEAPWQVSLWRYLDLPGTRDDGFYLGCGGSILSPTVVVTAAHCVQDRSGRRVPARDLAVVAGATEPRRASEPLLAVDRVAPNVRSLTSDTDDIAYLRLATPLVLSTDAGATQQAIATATPDDVDRYPAGTAARVSGWGAVDEPGTAYPDALHGVTVPVVGDADCQARYDQYAQTNPRFAGTVIDAPTMVCAGTDTEDSCFGDSGGPLWIDDDGTPLLIGVTSFGGDPCADALAPGVYTELAAYADMTEAHLGAAPFTDVSFGHPFLTEVFHLAADGVLGGYEDGSYRSAAVVTRQAMSAFLHRLAGEPPVTPPAIPTFADVPSSHPFSDAIEWMADQGITTGFDTPGGRRYRPGAPVTRQAMSAFMHRLAGEPPFTPPATPTFADVAPSHPFSDAIEWMADQGITTGYPDGTYRPGSPVSRQSMAAFLYRLRPIL